MGKQLHTYDLNLFNMEWMKDHYSLSISISEQVKENCLPMYSLTIRSEAIELCKKLYLNSFIYLERKYKRAIHIINFFG